MNTAAVPDRLGWAGLPGKEGETGTNWLRRVDGALRRELAANQRRWLAMPVRERDKALRLRGLRV